MDPFHVVRLGGDALDQCRRRVQQELHGHRGRKDDPLYRARPTYMMASAPVVVTLRLTGALLGCLAKIGPAAGALPLGTARAGHDLIRAWPMQGLVYVLSVSVRTVPTPRIEGQHPS